MDECCLVISLGFIV